MTHVKALQAGHSSQGTSEPITPACREAPETLWLTWVLTSGETEVRGMWVFPGRDLLCFGRLLYKLGLSDNSQEALSMCMNVIVS